MSEPGEIVEEDSSIRKYGGKSSKEYRNRTEKPKRSKKSSSKSSSSRIHSKKSSRDRRSRTRTKKKSKNKAQKSKKTKREPRHKQEKTRCYHATPSPDPIIKPVLRQQPAAKPFAMKPSYEKHRIDRTLLHENYVTYCSLPTTARFHFPKEPSPKSKYLINYADRYQESWGAHPQTPFAAITPNSSYQQEWLEFHGHSRRQQTDFPSHSQHQSTGKYEYLGLASQPIEPAYFSDQQSFQKFQRNDAQQSDPAIISQQQSGASFQRPRQVRQQTEYYPSTFSKRYVTKLSSVVCVPSGVNALSSIASSNLGADTPKNNGSQETIKKSKSKSVELSDSVPTNKKRSSLTGSEEKPSRRSGGSSRPVVSAQEQEEEDEKLAEEVSRKVEEAKKAELSRTEGVRDELGEIIPISGDCLEEISDDELDEEGGIKEDKSEIGADRVDWSSLLAWSKQQKTEEGVSTFRQRFARKNFLRTMPFSKKLLGNNLAGEIENECNKELAEGDQNFKFEHETCWEHMAALSKREARKNLFTNKGTCGAALSARFDLQIRRTLCGLGPDFVEPVNVGETGLAYNPSLYEMAKQQFKESLAAAN